MHRYKKALAVISFVSSTALGSKMLERANASPDPVRMECRRESNAPLTLACRSARGSVHAWTELTFSGIPSGARFLARVDGRDTLRADAHRGGDSDAEIHIRRATGSPIFFWPSGTALRLTILPDAGRNAITADPILRHWTLNLDERPPISDQDERWSQIITGAGLLAFGLLLLTGIALILIEDRRAKPSSFRSRLLHVMIDDIGGDEEHRMLRQEMLERVFIGNAVPEEMIAHLASTRHMSKDTIGELWYQACQELQYRFSLASDTLGLTTAALDPIPQDLMRYAMMRGR